jgi:5'-phosphate synthase pdxT subunit
VIGVLALQGAFREHMAAMRRLGREVAVVRDPDELEGVDALVMPGGESTTMDKLMRKFGLQGPIRRRLQSGMPVLATCAGLILLATEVLDGLPDQDSLRVLPLTARRNAYGRQPDSFEADLEVSGLDRPFPGIFIRAPVIERVGGDVEVLATVDGHPVAVRHGNVFGLTFHPELSGDDRLHRLFLESTEPTG